MLYLGLEGAKMSELHPVYPFGPVGAPIELYDGTIAVNGGDPHPGRIFADLAGRLQLRWQLTDSEPEFDRGDVQLELDHPDAGTITVPAGNNSHSGAGWITNAVVGDSDAECDRVIAHFTNLPTIFPAGSGRWAMSGAGWELTIEGRPDHAEALAELRRSLFFVVTHVGELRRTDGSSFTASEAVQALEAWQLALSFALGRWIAPLIPVGFLEGKRVWEHWASWRCDPVSTDYLPWWSNAEGDDLKAFAKVFLEAWFSSDEEREIVRHVAHHLIAAHHWGTTTEAKIMLVHAALEYLSWVTYVLTKKRTASQHAKEGKDRTPAATWHLKELLRPAKIKVAIPTQLAALRKFARQEGVPSGPAAVSRVRNKLVHPKDAGEPYRIEGLVFQAWQLASEYGELLLLKRIGYQGKYLPRTDIRGWVDTVPVPWAKQKSAN
jgi:hypothetical protein